MALNFHQFLGYPSFRASPQESFTTYATLQPNRHWKKHKWPFEGFTKPVFFRISPIGPMTKASRCLLCVFPCFPMLRPPGTISTRIAVSTFGSLLCHATAVARAVAADRRRCTGTAERRGTTGPVGTAPGASNGDVLGWSQWSQYHKLLYKPLS